MQTLCAAVGRWKAWLVEAAWCASCAVVRPSLGGWLRLVGETPTNSGRTSIEGQQVGEIDPAVSVEICECTERGGLWVENSA